MFVCVCVYISCVCFFKVFVKCVFVKRVCVCEVFVCL